MVVELFLENVFIRDINRCIMEIIPFIKMKRRKIIDSSYSSIEEALDGIEKDQTLYILDLDGTEKGKPNLCTFQKLSPDYQLWVDYGPRNLGDVVDIFMAGATDITIRKNLCPNLKISDIREISENKIYVNIDFEEQKLFSGDDLFLKDYDGLVNFNGKEKIEQDFKYSDFLNRIRMRNKIYCYENEAKNSFFLESIWCRGVDSRYK